MATALLLYFCVIILFCFIYLVWNHYNYWKKRKVPYVKPSVLFGNFKDYVFLNEDFTHIEQRICQRFSNEPYIGVFYGTAPTLIVQDPELIRLILATKFNVFNGREITRYTTSEMITNNLFYTYGERWKLLHQTASPLFSLSRLRCMFHLVEKCATDLERLLDIETKTSSTVNISDLMARYTMDCIGACILGLSTNTMNTDDKNPFKIMGHKIFATSTLRSFLFIVRSIWPSVFYGLRLKLFPAQITDFFFKLYKDVCESRQYKPSSRNDFVDHMLSAGSSDDAAVGMYTSLFGAGFETSATTMSHTLYELAKNQDVQRRAAEEVDEYLVRHNHGKITYECVNELRYLYACIEETLRLYPLLAILTREVMEDYTLPTGLLVEKGLRIHVPVYALHRDPNYFPEPERYRPERFLKDTIRPFTYLPYGEGPRKCMGKQMAKMQMLPCLIMILKKFRVELAEGTSPELELDVGTITTRTKGPILLKFIPRFENTSH